MQRASRWGAIGGSLAVLLATLALVPSAARAGNYTISGGGCGFWQPYDLDPTDVAVFPTCLGVTTRNVGGSGAAPTGAEGGWIFVAPAGTLVTAYTVNGTMLGLNGWQASLHATYGPDAEGCPGSGCPGGSKLVGGVWYQGYNSPAVAMQLRCGSTSGCSRAAEYGHTEVDTFAATLFDGSVPNVGITGGNALNGWRRGTSTVSYDASDNSGIKIVRAYIDGRPRAEVPRGCNYSSMVPCPNGGGSLDVDTAGLDDGGHQLTVQAVDAGDNVSNDARTIDTDNTPPSSPASPTLDGGDIWRTTDSFDVSWSNPPQSASPIVAADYVLCPSSNAARDSSGCQSGDRSGTNIDRISDLEVPGTGSWKLSLYLVDAAGNAASSAAVTLPGLKYDPDPPRVAFLPISADDPTRVRIAASDATSGVNTESLEIRLDGTPTWTEIPVVADAAGFSAALDDGALPQGLYHLRARVADAAGNERTIESFDDGQSATLSLPVRLKTRLAVGRVKRVLAHASSSGRKRYRRVLVAKPRSPYGRTVRLSGRLTTPGANPVAGMPVEVWQQVESPGAPWTQIATVQTSRTGRFVFKALRGPSRLLQFRYGGTTTIRSRVSTVDMRVKATSSLRVDRHHVNNGDFVSFHGRLKGQPIPAGGKLVELQVFTRGQWRTFAQPRASSGSGLYSYRYRFEAITGRVRFRFRARIRREATYPFDLGYSRQVRVTVRGT